MLTDSSVLPVCVKTVLSVCIRNSPFSLEFLISRIADESILGMSFLVGQKCMLCLTTLPPEMEAQVLCWSVSELVGLVENGIRGNTDVGVAATVC